MQVNNDKIIILGWSIPLSYFMLHFHTFFFNLAEALTESEKIEKRCDKYSKPYSQFVRPSGYISNH